MRIRPIDVMSELSGSAKNLPPHVQERPLRAFVCGNSAMLLVARHES